MIVVIGGQTRNVGKTTLMCRLIAATRELQWSAIKITQFGHQACTQQGKRCGCAPGEAAHPFVLEEERGPGPSDSQRYLAAGASRAYWLRTRQGELAEALPVLRPLLSGPAPLMIESNSVLDLIQPDLYFPVLHPEQSDFKNSALRQLRRADVIVLAAAGPLPCAARGIPTLPAQDWPELVRRIRQAVGKRKAIVSSPASDKTADSEPR